MEFESDLQSNLAGFLTKSIYLNKIHHYWEVPTTLHVFITTLWRKFKVFKEKVKGSDHDVSTVVLRVFLFEYFLLYYQQVIAWFRVQFGNNMHE